MIQMTKIVKRFGANEVLSDVNFQVEEGEIFGLLGPSGAGKTTIINILTGQLSADEGEYRIDVPFKGVGLMLDSDGLYDRLSCLENLHIFTTLYGVEKRRALAALESVGLTEAAKKPVNNLSKGMRQRLALARAILHSPKVLFLDEPTSGLDPATARGIHRLLLNLRQRHSTIFLTTHNMDEALKLCDRVALLHRGVIVEQGQPQQLCKKYHAVKSVPDLEAVFLKLTGAELE